MLLDNLGALNTVVPSELTRRVGMGELLVLLVCWKSGPYGVPDQQGDSSTQLGNNLLTHHLIGVLLITIVDNT
jgi:hypothetical protein